MNHFKILLFSLLSLYACKLSTTDELTNELQTIVKSWLGVDFSLPDSVNILNGNSLSEIIDDPFVPATSKILTFISGDCEKCIHEMKKWNVLMDSLNLISRVDLIPVVFTTDLDYFLSIFRSVEKPEFKIYIDTKFRFLFNYHLPDDWKYRTFLLDSNNKVILVGNPLYNSKIKDLTINKISQHE